MISAEFHFSNTRGHHVNEFLFGSIQHLAEHHFILDKLLLEELVSTGQFLMTGNATVLNRAALAMPN